MEDINDAGHKYAKRFCKDLKKKEWYDYHEYEDFYVQSDTVLLAI